MSRTCVYAKLVTLYCALKEEEGKAKFLGREALSSNTSDDHYTCFSDDEAGERLYTIMTCVTPEEMITVDCEPIELLPDGRVQYTFAPETTRQRAGHVGRYTLQPNEEIVILCPHGVVGFATTRGFNEDGTLRRKTSRKTK